MEKRLYRSRGERMVWGVCGGLANYFDMDPAIVRIIFALLVLANGAGIIIYIVMAIVIPLEGSKVATSQEAVKENMKEMKETATSIGREIRSTLDKASDEETTGKIKRHRNMLGFVLITIGIVFLLNNFNLFGWFGWSFIWPAIFIAVGLLIIFNSRRKK